MIDVKELNKLSGDAFNMAFHNALRDELKSPHNNGELARLCRVSKGAISYSWIIAFTDGRIKQAKNSSLLKLAKYIGIESTPEGKLYTTNRHFNPPLPTWETENQEEHV